MDDMDIDVVEEATLSSFNPRMGSRRKKHTPPGSNPGPRTFGRNGVAIDDTEQQQRRARLVQLINETLETEHSSQAQNEVLPSEQNGGSNEGIRSGRSFERSLKHPGHAHYHHRDKGSWKKKGNDQCPVFDGGDFILKSKERRGKNKGIVLSSDPFQHNVPWKDEGQRRLVYGGHLAPCSSAKSRMSSEVDCQGRSFLSEGETCSSFTKVNDKMKMKVVDSPSLSLSKPKTCLGHQKCSFPPEGSVYVSNREEGTSGHLSDRRHKITIDSGDYVHVDDSVEITASGRLNPNAVLATSDSEARDRSKQILGMKVKGQRKCSLACSNYGRSSSLDSENSEMLDLESPGPIPYTRSARTYDSQNHVHILDPVAEVDELESPKRGNKFQEQSSRDPDLSASRASQVESDEMLARLLQEQFNAEIAGSASTEEIDATIAWSLQQEDARSAASTTRTFQSDHRETSMAHLYEYYAQLPYRNSATGLSDRASNRRRNYGSDIDLERRMIAEVRNFTGMDPGMKRDFLEALEAAFDHSNDELSESGLVTHHEFNESDYEILLALDENNHQHLGASESEINNLPQSIIKSDNVGEACAVCLENPTAGDTIRHLPCFHKFHKECIDTWLKRKTWCPVCKSEIT
ncbi:uncharacterized protein A4U43_C07F19150 [Asparagus officinalis]|uniref:RING-type domain-containing protein n=1 Tax=Asparagus officinalis TaxID=4686 RepID=A0A5P1EF16_ASPOF|nr:uncharacterized protein LOC109848371 [Asparagus officinalis]ONK63807.1 uncharacterized protein A4U43_C07F19150 [Asparagus officinalis]